MRTIIGVLRGGPSSEFDVSLGSGSAILNSMPDNLEAKEIFIDKEGIWHSDGIPRTPVKILQRFPIIFNALHGSYGEDGKVQKVLDQSGSKYTGSDAFASMVAMNKALTKDIYKEHNLQTPDFMLVTKKNYTKETPLKIARKLGTTLIVKPLNAGSSVGVTIAQNEAELEEALAYAFDISDTALVEECISGREATCGVIDNFRDKEYYPLPPIEIIIPQSSSFFDYAAKYDGQSKELCPSTFRSSLKRELENQAIAAHRALGLRHYSRSDFIIHPTRGIFILETNTLPGLTPESLFPKSLEAVGVNLSEFVGHVVELAQQT